MSDIISCEDYIQFSYDWEQCSSFRDNEQDNSVLDVSSCRNRCLELGVVGASDDGIGFGNVSIKLGNGTAFLITGTQTGHIDKVDGSHFCKINTFNIHSNYVSCVGPVKPSSEALTHAAVYSAAPEVSIVVHGHHSGIWERFYRELPGTSSQAANGTVQLSLEIAEISLKNQKALPQGVILRGHQDGFLVYGNCKKAIIGYISNLLDSV